MDHRKWIYIRGDLLIQLIDSGIFLFLYLLFGCPSANLGSFLKEKRLTPNINYYISF